MIWKTYGRCGWNEHVVNLPWDFGGRLLKESLSPECLGQRFCWGVYSWLVIRGRIITYNWWTYHDQPLHPLLCDSDLAINFLLCTQYLPHSYHGLVGLMPTTGCGRVGHNHYLVCTAHHLRCHWRVVSSFDMSTMNVDCSKWSSWHGWYRICVALLRVVAGFLASIT